MPRFRLPTPESRPAGVRPLAPGAGVRRSAALGISALVHVAVVVFALLGPENFDGFPPVMEEAVPVEIVLVRPAAEESEVPVPEPAAPEPEAAPASEAEKVAPEPEPEAPEAPDAPEPETEAPDAKEPEPALPEGFREAPERRPGDVPPPRIAARPAAKYIGVWRLEPMVVDYGHRCGSARLSGRLRITRELAPGRFRGVLRTTIRWARCRPEGARYAVELRIEGDRVTMTGSGGFVDRGVIQKDIMLLKDTYGRSLWRKQ